MIKTISTYTNYLKYYIWCFLIFQFLRFLNGLGLYQLKQPPIHEIRQDPLVWNFIFTGIPDFISSNPMLSLLMDISVCLPVFFILFLKLPQNIIQRLIGVHILLFSIYLLIIFSYPSLSIRKYLGLALVPILFLFTKPESYKKALSCLRIYVLFIFCSAAMWKLFRGAIFESDQFLNILRNQHLEHIVLFPNHITTHVSNWLIGHSQVANIFYLLIAGVQLSFITGFFTKKYDRLLLAGFLLFILGDFLVMRVEYWEFMVFMPLFFLERTLTNQNML